MCEEIPNVTVRVFLSKLRTIIKFKIKKKHRLATFFINLDPVIDNYDTKN